MTFFVPGRITNPLNGSHGHWSVRARWAKQWRFLTKEIAQAYAVQSGDDETQAYHELARRLPELEREVLVRVQQDPSLPCRCRPDDRECHCHDVKRGGSRVWEVCE